MEFAQEGITMAESSKSPAQRVKKGGVFYGYWIVLASAFVAAVNSGLYFYGFGAFFTYITAELGTTRAVLSGGIALARLEGGLIGPVEGWLIDKFGPRKIMFLGIPLLGTGFILMSQVNSVTMFYVVFIGFLSLGSALGSVSPASAAVANWFNRKRSTMLGFMLAGVGMGGLCVPIVTLLISNLGWRQALVVIGVVITVISFPLASVMRHKPEQYGYYPDNEEPAAQAYRATDAPVSHGDHGSYGPSATDDGLTAKEALKTPAFWFMSLTFALRVGTTSAVALHFIPFLTDIGLGLNTAGIMSGALAVISVAGRLGFGWLGDMFPKRLVVAGGLVSLTLGMLALAFSTNIWQVGLALLLYAPSYGGLATMMFAMRGEYFGRRSFATIQGFMGMVMLLGTVTGPIYAGWIFDVTNSYRIAFLTFAGLTLLAILLILAAKKPASKTSAQVATA
ncbi:MAG: MFS transporter [Dehalococcoidia bacterium]|nr:MFS transporter [Dehalococcoidia bacterium]